jgi:NadR type nicotinamide-nucleotide adenylyltransferase
MIHVVLTGSESVGKTTLASQLAAHFGTLVVPEFVREYAASKGAPLDFRDHGPIAKGQMALEDRFLALAATREDSLLIHDTDLVSTVVYCHHYFGRCPAFIEEAAVERRPSHYFLLDIDVPWIADGVRDRGDQRLVVQQLFVETLDRLDAPYTIVSGTWAARFDVVAQCITELAPR